MTDTTDVLGPVDWLVVEFPADKANFSGEMAAELKSLVERELVRVLDLVFIRKNEDGSVDIDELSDTPSDAVGELLAHEAALAMVLAEEDLVAVGEALEPDSIAAVLVWENTWAGPFAGSVRRSGGQLIDTGRIPTQALIAAIEAEDQEPVKEGVGDAHRTRARRPARRGRPPCRTNRSRRRNRRRRLARRQPPPGPPGRPARPPPGPPRRPRGVPLDAATAVCGDSASTSGPPALSRRVASSSRSSPSCPVPQ